MERIHVYPLGDMREHETDRPCWCKPEIDEEHELVIHRAADGREDFETGRRKPS